MSVEIISLQLELHQTQVAAEAAAGQGSVKVFKLKFKLIKTKPSSPTCLFLFNNNVDLKNNDRECRKPFWVLWVRE